MTSTPEADARKNIDRQLQACGWMVQDRRATDLTASSGVAIREFPLQNGEEADYLLYANGKAIGVFEAFVEQVLVPELRSSDVVIMDNLSSHKRRRIRELIEATGAHLVFLPPYSPDLNPIEMIFAKVKQSLRSLACRTRDALWEAMQSVLDRVTTSDAANCYKHCGYTLHLD